MKVKFNTFDKVNQFVRLATTINGDVFLKSGKYVVDGCSIMGVYSLDLSKELELEIIERREGEIDRFVSILKDLNIVTE